MKGWEKALFIAGGAAGVAGLLYYLLREERSSGKQISGSAEAAKDARGAVKKQDVNEISKEQVEQILQEIIASQNQMKGFMISLQAELRAKSLTFEETYRKVREIQPEDPLEKRGLSMTDFDKLLDKHQSDSNVREAIATIMGAPKPNTATTEKVQAITLEQIIVVHDYMHKELESIVWDFQNFSNKDSYDSKTLAIAAQAIVGAKIEAKFY